METALLIICALLLLALATCICAMLIYTHKRMDNIVELFNKMGMRNSETFQEIYNNNRILKAEIEKLTNAHNGLVVQLAENEANKNTE